MRVGCRRRTAVPGCTTLVTLDLWHRAGFAAALKAEWGMRQALNRLAIAAACGGLLFGLAFAPGCSGDDDDDSFGGAGSIATSGSGGSKAGGSGGMSGAGGATSGSGGSTQTGGGTGGSKAAGSGGSSAGSG